MIRETYNDITARSIFMERFLNYYKILKYLNSKISTTETNPNLENYANQEIERQMVIEDVKPTGIFQKNISDISQKNVQNINLKNRYSELLKEQDKIKLPRLFQVYHVFKTKIKRMYRVDCMTRKLNV